MSLSAITDRRIHVQPAEVHNVLGRHMLADGYDIVMDLKKSKGSWVFDSRRGRNVLDFFTNFASVPVGYNHPKMDTPEFRDRISDAAINKPANSDIYTTYMAEFVETFARVAMPPSFMKHMFFVEGGVAGDRERDQDRFRLEGPQELQEGLDRRKRTAGHASARVLPRPQRLHAVADEHRRSAQDAVLPEVRLAAHRQSEAGLPAHGRSARRRRAPRAGRARSGQAVPARAQRRHRGIHHGADPRRRGRQPLPPRVLPRRAPALRRERHAPHLRRSAVGRRHHRQDVGVRALRRRARSLLFREKDAGLRLRLQRAHLRHRRTTSSPSPRASTRRGAAT